LSKGSKQRPELVKGSYSENYDRIFRKSHEDFNKRIEKILTDDCAVKPGIGEENHLWPNNGGKIVDIDKAIDKYGEDAMKACDDLPF